MMTKKSVVETVQENGGDISVLRPWLQDGKSIVRK